MSRNRKNDYSTGPAQSLLGGLVTMGGEWRAQKKKRRSSGLALLGHCLSAHGGKEDMACPACKELRAAIQPEEML